MDGVFGRSLFGESSSSSVTGGGGGLGGFGFGERGDAAAVSSVARLKADAQSYENSFKEYLRDVLPEEQVAGMAERGERRYILDLDDLRREHAPMAAGLLHNAEILLPHLVSSLNQYAKEVLARSPDPKIAAAEVGARWSLGFTGSFAANHVNPRTLCSLHLWSLISVEGMVTKCSSIHPLLVRSLHYCPKTKAEYPRSYQDESTSLGRSSLRAQYFPTKDVDGNVLEPEYGYFEYRDHQTAVVQEMPEHAPAGQLPRSVPVVLDDDLVDQVKPGDRVQVVGVYRAVPGSALGRGGRGGGGGGGILAFRTVLVATNVRKVMRDASAVVFSGQDLENILAVREVPDVYERMAASLAPSIFGHDAVKKALLLQLLGGQEKRTHSGIHLRGDIHLLLVGDPSTAKSQLLRFMLHVAPLAVSTNARGASGVGLTAAVVADPDTHERALEAGAMVLADRGVVCIDEFDKMSVDDRAALHEVMEQQTITIQKAGVHASLNARCSVFAAANPIYGSYNRDKNVMQNIGFPSTLLSRFDALFVILDPADARRDRAIAQHVLRMHREGRHVPLAVAASGSRAAASSSSSSSSSGGGGDTGAAGRLFGGAPAVDLEETMRLAAASSTADDAADASATPVFAGTVSGGGGGGVMSAERIAEILAADPHARFSVDFIRKYVSYARLKVNPAMTMEAGTVLVEAYADFRQRSRPQPGGGGYHHHQATLPITARMLESMVRLSEAHARCRLAPTVTVDDANAAVALLRFALYSEGDGSPEAAAVSAAPQQQHGEDEDADERRKRRGNSDRKRKTKRRRGAGDEGESAATAVRRCVQELFGDYEMVTLEKILDSLGDRFPRQPVEDALLAMHNDGQLLYTDGVAYRT